MLFSTGKIIMSSRMIRSAFSSLLYSDIAERAISLSFRRAGQGQQKEKHLYPVAGGVAHVVFAKIHLTVQQLAIRFEGRLKLDMRAET